MLNNTTKLSNNNNNNRLIFRQLWDKDSSTFTYLLADAMSKEAVLIDPVLEQVERDVQLLHELNLIPKYLLNTHIHADHVTGTGLLKQKFPSAAPQSVLGNRGNQLAMSDLKVSHHDIIPIGKSFDLQVRETPGHTEGCVSYVLRDVTNKIFLAVFTGDALLIRGCGRTDFQGGSAKILYQSIWEQIFTLPDDVVIFPAHDYKGHTSSTVGEEKLFNPRLTKSMDEFESIMKNLNLTYPNKIDIALPANRVCGLHEILKDDSGNSNTKGICQPQVLKNSSNNNNGMINTGNNKI
jgi:sulfur dioxygenase